MNWMFSGERSVIGLDVGAWSIKAAQLCRAGGKRVVSASLVLPRTARGEPLSIEEAMRLREVLDRRGFHGRRVVAAVPSVKTLTSVLDVPPRSSGAPLDQIAKAEMARAHRQEPGAIEVAFWDLPEPARKSETMQVMAAACRHDDADALIEPLQNAGFDVLSLDLAGWAVARSFRELFVEPNSLAAAIDIGWGASTFVLLHEGMLVYERHLEGCGISSVSQAVVSELGLDSAVVDYLLYDVGFDVSRCECQEDRQLSEKMHRQLGRHFRSLADELRLSIAYAGHQYPGRAMQGLFVHGGGACVPGLTEKLAEWLELPTQLGTVQLPAGGAGVVNGPGSAALRVAVGLADYREQEAAA